MYYGVLTIANYYKNYLSMSMNNHFEKIDAHLKHDLLIIVSILSFFACYILLRFIATFENAVVLGSSLAILGFITLGFAVIDYVRYKVRAQKDK